MDYRRRSYTTSSKRVSRKSHKRAFREFKRSSWAPRLSLAGQGPRYQIDGPPQSIMQKLRYVGTGSLITAAVAGNETVVTYPLDPFAVGGILAPTNHQPTGFDQWATLYANWRVRATRIRITFQANPATSNVNSCWFASTIIPPSGGTGYPDYVSAAQDPRSKSGVGSSYNSGITVHKHYNTLQMLAGAVDPTDDVYTGSPTAGANSQATLFMIVRNGPNPQGIQGAYQVDIKFYMEFFSPLGMPKST